MTEPNEATKTAGPIPQTGEIVLDGPPPHVPSPEEVVPGERLVTPIGATRVVGDYGRPRPSYVFLAIVSIVTLASDVATKAWAAKHLEGYPGIVEVWKNHLTLVLARNRGGAWGLLQSTSENVRRPFFLLVSVAAIAFIMTLYRRLLPRQRALKWGLPLVLGGALGNVLDRIRYGQVIDFIDAHILFKGAERHWPTFNVADIAICVGVGLMAIDMFTSKRGHPIVRAPSVPPAQSGEPSVEWKGAIGEPAPPPAPPEIPPAARG
ncbi:MAG TPA: signal peptidase II [Polyangiaceae bacterium]|nr:signal peptidase II [Polyangiaceae bacterium]